MGQVLTGVLVVDDDEATLRAFARRWGRSCPVHVACTPDAGIEIARTHAISLALIDLYLPNPVGIELIARIKATRSLYAVLVSASMSLEWAHFASVADDVVAKPFTLDEVLRRRDDPLGRRTTDYCGRTTPLDQLERDHTRRVLAACGGNKSLAARRLEISRARLERILERD